MENPTLLADLAAPYRPEADDPGGRDYNLNPQRWRNLRASNSRLSSRLGRICRAARRSAEEALRRRPRSRRSRHGSPGGARPPTMAGWPSCAPAPSAPANRANTRTAGRAGPFARRSLAGIRQPIVRLDGVLAVFLSGDLRVMPVVDAPIMNAVLDYAALQEMLAGWPDAALPDRASDGVFSGCARSCRSPPLYVAQAPERRRRAAPLLRQVLRRESSKSGTPARIRVGRGGGWPDSRSVAAAWIVAQALGGRISFSRRLPWAADWLAPSDRPVFEDAFAEVSRATTARRPIDPFLQEASGFELISRPANGRQCGAPFSLPACGDAPRGFADCLESLVAQSPVLVHGLEGGAYALHRAHHRACARPGAADDRDAQGASSRPSAAGAGLALARDLEERLWP